MPYKDPEKHRSVERERYRNHRNEILPRKQAYNSLHRERIQADKRARRARLKLEVLNAYGGPQCVCCGELNIEFLTLDHPAKDGPEHRAQLGLGRRGGPLYDALKKQNFPPGLRVLCSNCNVALGNYGYCPHGNVRIEPDSKMTGEGKGRRPEQMRFLEGT